jgi:hypothetical protein
MLNTTLGYTPGRRMRKQVLYEIDMTTLSKILEPPVPNILLPTDTTQRKTIEIFREHNHDNAALEKFIRR